MIPLIISHAVIRCFVWEGCLFFVCGGGALFEEGDVCLERVFKHLPQYTQLPHDLFS